jgi:N-acetyl-alpha-D-glucosaminyl L-malate synthase BshA
MKIGIVCYPTYGGSGVVATELGRFLALRGHEVHFISSAVPFRLVHDAIDGVFFHEVQSLEYPVLQGELYGIAVSSKIVQVVQHHNLDVVHAHYAVPHAISAFIARATLGHDTHPFRVVTTLHGTDITLVGRAPSFFPLVQYAINRSDAVTTVSEWLKAETIREFDIRRPIEVISNFVDTSKFRRGHVPCKRSHFAPNGEKILMHISNFRPVKRVEDVVRIFARVRERIPAVLLMIGDGPDRDKAHTLARELGVLQHVRFLGKQESIEHYMSCADLFLFPSEYESFGLAALEALSCEIPVVASASGGLPEVIDHGETGFLAPPGDVETMAAHAIDILSDSKRLLEMGRLGRQRVEARYLASKVIPRYEELYARVMDRSARVERNGQSAEDLLAIQGGWMGEGI